MKILNVLEGTDLAGESYGQDVVADMYYKYRITSFSKPVIITFPPIKEKETHDPSISPFGFDFLCRFDVNIISFGVLGPDESNYFITPEFSRFMESLGLLLRKFTKRLGYANSKGGFGVGAYASALHLDTALLFFPVSTKNKELVPWDNRRTTKSVQHLDWNTPYGDVNTSNCRGYVLYDPLDSVDVNHANRFKGLTHVKIHGLAHGSSYHFLSKNTSVISNTLRDFIYKNEVDVASLKNDCKALRLTTRYYEDMLQRKAGNKALLKNLERLKSLTKSTHSNKDIDLIRDSALAMESVDLDRALLLMEFAHSMRPNGSFINKKVIEYRSKLSSASSGNTKNKWYAF